MPPRRTAVDPQPAAPALKVAAGVDDSVGRAVGCPEHAMSDKEVMVARAALMPPLPHKHSSGSASNLAETAGVLIPALSVDAPLAFVRQPNVTQGKDGRTLVGRQRDLDDGRPGRNRRMAFPTPGHDEPPGRFDLSIMTRRNVLAVDINPITPSGSRVELGADPHPLHKTAAVGEVGEHDFGRGLDPLRNLDRTGQVFNHSVAAASVPPVLPAPSAGRRPSPTSVGG